MYFLFRETAAEYINCGKVGQPLWLRGMFSFKADAMVDVGGLAEAAPSHVEVLKSLAVENEVSGRCSLLLRFP